MNASYGHLLDGPLPCGNAVYPPPHLCPLYPFFSLPLESSYAPLRALSHCHLSEGPRTELVALTFGFLFLCTLYFFLPSLPLSIL